MHKLIGALALLVLVGGTGSSAHADGPWCAFYDASTYNCGFYSFEQCYETVRGAGGSCRPNFFQKLSVTPGRQDGARHQADVTDQDQTEIKSCFEHSLSRRSSVSPPWYLRKAVLLLKAGGAPSTAVAARIADSTHTDSVVRTSEVLGARVDGICRGGDERTSWRCTVEPSADLLQPCSLLPPLASASRRRMPVRAAAGSRNSSRRCASPRETRTPGRWRRNRLAHSSMSNRRRPRSDAPSSRRKRRSRPPWHAPSGSMRKEIARDARGRSPPPSGCTICDDRLARGPFQTEFREATQVGKSGRAAAGDRWRRAHGNAIRREGAFRGGPPSSRRSSRRRPSSRAAWHFSS